MREESRQIDNFLPFCFSFFFLDLYYRCLRLYTPMKHLKKKKEMIVRAAARVFVERWILFVVVTDGQAW